MVYRAQSASTEAAQILKSLMVEICAFRADAYLSAFCSPYIVPCHKPAVSVVSIF